MSALLERPRFASVDDSPAAAQIAARRTRLGMTVSALAKASGVDRGSISKIEKLGRGRDSTIGAITETLDRLEQEMGMDLPAASELAAEGLVEFQIEGNFGVSVIMKGPVSNMAQMEAAAARLVERMQSDRRDS